MPLSKNVNRISRVDKSSVSLTDKSPLISEQSKEEVCVMASNFLYSTRDHKFIIKEWLDGGKILGLKRFRDVFSIEDVDGILDQSLRVCKDVVAPTNDDGDTIRAVFKEGNVTVPPSFHNAFKYVADNGWGASNKDKDGEGSLPSLLYGAVHEYMIAANPAFVAYLGLPGGVGSIIKQFGSREQIDFFTPRMFEAVWGGTMCITEPGGGSDVGDKTQKANPTAVSFTNLTLPPKGTRSTR